MLALWGRTTPQQKAGLGDARAGGDGPCLSAQLRHGPSHRSNSGHVRCFLGTVCCPGPCLESLGPPTARGGETINTSPS